MTETQTPLTNTMILWERTTRTGTTVHDAPGGAWGIPAEAMAAAEQFAADQGPDYFDRFGARIIGTRTVNVRTGETTDTMIEVQ